VHAVVRDEQVTVLVEGDAVGRILDLAVLLGGKGGEDRLRSQHDYQVNLKAELEIRSIGERVDQLIHHQWARLIEIQQIQIEMIEDLAARRGQ
jgi:hypothetical protein